MTDEFAHIWRQMGWAVCLSGKAKSQAQISPECWLKISKICKRAGWANVFKRAHVQLADDFISMPN